MIFLPSGVDFGPDVKASKPLTMERIFCEICLATGIRFGSSKKMYRRNKIVRRIPHQDAESTVAVKHSQVSR